MKPDVINDLHHKLGNCILTDKDSLFRASFDAMKISSLPEAVIRPNDPEQIGVALKLANQYQVPLTTRGAGSSLTGSATPIQGGWVLDMSRLTAIKIDPFNKYAQVQTGAITAEIQKQAEKVDLFYPPDPSSSSFCTIGGNIACNAGGLRGVKYGVTRDYIVALKGFLPTGEFVSWGLPLRKYASGYNIRDLWIGSEGTLGVITEATLKLIKKPAITKTFLAKFGNEEETLNAAQRLLELGIVPSILEFMGCLTVEATLNKQRKSLATENSYCILLIELDGSLSSIEEEKGILLKWAKKYVNQFIEAKDNKESDQLWQIRRECSAAMFQFGNSKLNEDIVVPLDKTVELIRFIENLSKKTSLKIPVFGHVGDGNFHVNIMYNQEDPAQKKEAEANLIELMQFVVKIDGAISGEHGIGLAKSPFLKLQHTESEIQAMRSIKQALDPNNILNPGKIFTPYSVWDYPRTQAKMPWEDKIHYS